MTWIDKARKHQGFFGGKRNTAARIGFVRTMSNRLVSKGVPRSRAMKAAWITWKRA